MQRLRLWTPARWAAATASGQPRAAVARHLAQSWADLAAGLEEEPRRVLPVLPDLPVPDQLAVTADDLVRAGPPAPVAAAAAAHLLLHRGELLEDDPPEGLLASLREVLGAEPLEAARARCIGSS